MLTSSQRAQLRSIASQESPTLYVGKAGLIENLVLEAQNILTARELLKGRVLESAALSAEEACQKLAELCGAEPVHSIGNTFVLYKRSVREPKIVFLSKN